MSFENLYNQHSSIEQIKSHYCYYMLIHMWKGENEVFFSNKKVLEILKIELKLKSR